MLIWTLIIGYKTTLMVNSESQYLHVRTEKSNLIEEAGSFI